MQIATSSFHTGDNKDCWVADIDWFLKPENSLKMLEAALLAPPPSRSPYVKGLRDFLSRCRDDGQDDDALQNWLDANAVTKGRGIVAAFSQIRIPGEDDDVVEGSWEELKDDPVTRSNERKIHE
jgi:hypothetical protein